MSTLRGIFQMEEPVRPESPPWPSHPVASPDGRAIWTRGTGRFWMVPEAFEDSLHLHLDCDGPVPPWWEWVNEDLLNYMFTGKASHDTEALVAEFLQMGIAPGQPFLIDMTFMSTCYGDEYDYEVDWELVAVEPWSAEQVLAAWEEWLKVFDEENPYAE